MKNLLTVTAVTLIIIGSIELITKLPEPTEAHTEETIVVEEPEPVPSQTVPTTTTTTTKKKTTKKTTQATRKGATGSKSEYMAYAKSVGGYNDTQMQCLDYLWSHESGWNPNSVNKSSGACGIPQAHPCSKIKKQQGSNDWQAQIRWGVNYIAGRYGGDPCNGWNHFKNKHWY